jgi:hypothetical protein
MSKTKNIDKQLLPQEQVVWLHSMPNVTSTPCRSIVLLRILSFKMDQILVFKTIDHIDGVTTYFTVFDILGPAQRGIQQHGNIFPTIRALKEMFKH